MIGEFLILWIKKVHCHVLLQVQEEELLMAELRKIEMRKKEREKKQQDLQKLITAAENQAENRLK